MEVIVGNFFEGVEGHDVVDVELRTGAGVQAFRDALEFLLIFGINFGPEHFAGNLAKEGPIALRGAHHTGLDGGKGVLDFLGEHVAMLEADGGGVASR